MDRTRNGNGYAANRITYQDIRAIAGDRPDEWEVQALLVMDAVRLDQDVPPTEDVVSERTVTPGLFDALFSSG